ncbi:NAD(P)H-dependent oxidoreductase [Vibrio rumoiensis]|uniref:NAD(P)H dehydrogenase n=1 Tax=Vibrio rumoiensis 1S-45 TaxID=1188252 RepID=A0A1E5E5S4_9VIBR|nr:NAD(P)H-dependent oxidoreductase [Vibrio rumoiensis]OEF29361.1 NAD(P)H dehydrogenase [Vibrio rumoiensis 1S-45]
MKKILVINANPKSISMCKSIAEHYFNEARLKHDVKKIDISAMDFKLNLSEGYDKELPLEPDLLSFQKMIQWSEHIVIVSPVWWGSIPAKFKGAIDRTFLPGFAFKYNGGKSAIEKLLTGRTSELIITLDTPPFWYKYFQGNLIYKQLKRAILEFSGIRNKSSTYFGPVLSSNKHTREKWFKKVESLANNI